MIIDFSKIETNIIEKFRDGEKNTALKMFTDDNNKIMQGVLEPGASIGLHTHEGNSEVIFILEGNGKVLYDGEYETLEKGSCHYCPMGHSHSLINDSNKDLVFFAVVPNH